MYSWSAIEHNAAIPDNFIDLRELIPNLNHDLRYFSTNNFVGERIPGYDAERVIGTLEMALALKDVQRELAYANLELRVFDAYRPQRAVDHFIRWAHDHADLRTKAAYYPNIGKEEIFPKGYLLERSSHSRGSTVDLTIIDSYTFTELDMGTPFDFFDEMSWPASLLVTPQQRANRLLLRSLMEKHGFVPVEEEWWHFTLKGEPYPETYFDFQIR
ncbi:MAG: M15 family metallopeptidase [Pseudomonadota bacterium]|nr:M15 family metallopeptidase [Pseudomonadota bacterium]